MRTSLAFRVLGIVVFSIVTSQTAAAEPTRCKATIVRNSAKFIQSKAGALANCERNVLVGKLPSGTDCHSEPKTAEKIAKASARLREKIAQACGGEDGVCGTAGDDSLVSIGWGGACPNFENGSCSNAIANCDDIADCLLCIGEAAADQAISLYYDALNPSAANSDLNRCQREIGRSTTNFLRKKSQALATCWTSVNLGRATDPCPVPGDGGKASGAIAKSEARKVFNICRACGGTDELCDGNGDLTPAMIGFVGNCPAVTVPGGGSCAGAINTLADIVACVDCVTEFKVDCVDRAAVPWSTSGYPGECNPGAVLTPTPTKTSTPGVTATRTATPTRTVTPTPTATLTTGVTPTVTRTATPTLTATPTVTLTTGVTPTATRTATPTATRTATPTVTATNVLTATPTVTRTATPTVTATNVLTATPTRTATPTVTRTATPTVTATATRTATPTVVAPTPTRTATRTATPTVTATVVAPTPTPTRTATRTPTPTVTSTPASLCGNGVVNAGEDCDPAGGPATSCQNASNTSAAFTCSASCTCACPTKVHFVGDANDPATILDTGWTGIAHRAPVITNGDVTIAVSGCAGSSRPCGICNVSGPIPNTGNQLRNQRCNADTSRQCTNAPGGTGGPCTGFGTCEFYFGAPLPLVAGGVGTCVENQFNGSVSGTANIETGAATTNAFLTSRVHSAVISTDTPCPVCVGDPLNNDNVLGGTCNGGPRSGLSCDGNGTVPDRPDFGTTSLDCPPPAGTIAVLPIDLSNSTGTVSKAITSGSPNCSAGGLPAGTKCACDTCNNVTAQPCDANADCPVSGGNPGICGGRRCVGGTNVGSPCTVASQCPGGGSCARPGEPTKPNGCVDDTTQPMVNGSLCVDTAPLGDNEGECPEGPPTGICSLSSGHQQRSCTTANDCCDDAPACTIDPPTPGDCEVSNRLCFLDNGLGGSIIASGMADPPTNDVSEPTLAAVFCIGPTSAPAVNIAAGLPGPGRTTLKGTASGLP